MSCESEKSKRKQDTTQISDRDIDNNHQAKEKSDKDSILKEESCQNKMFRYEKVEAHEQKLYKTTLSWKQKLDSKQTHSVDKETDPLRLITIREETETRDEAEMHNEMQENVEIQLNQKDNKINIIECQETKLTTNDVEEEEDVMVRVTKDRRRNTTKIGTTYVNGQKVLATFDSCSSLTFIHHDLQ